MNRSIAIDIGPEEFARLLEEFQDIPPPERDDATLREIALKKATTVAEALAAAEEAADAAQNALEKERAYSAALAVRLKNTRNNLLTQARILAEAKQANRRLAADIGDARANVKLPP